MLIDSHCHINDPVYLAKAKDYVLEARANNVSLMLVVGYDVKSSLDAVKIAEEFEDVYAAVGIIPAEVKNMKKDDLKEIEKLFKHPKVIAVGEIGLDYYWDKTDELKHAQKKVFIEQIALANKFDLPVSIHCRDAYQDLLEILKHHKINKKGIIHCYSSSPELAKEFNKLGYLLGLGGTVTFKNAITPKAVAKYVPMNGFVLETDAPYLTPTPHRGEINHSKYLSFIRDEIANLKGVDPITVEEETTKNFKKLFNLWNKQLMEYW